MTDERRLDAAIQRMQKLMAAITVAGAIALFVLRGWTWSGGWLLGCTASGLNFHWLRRVTESLGSAGAGQRKAVLLGLRYLLLGGGAYVILRFTAAEIGLTRLFNDHLAGLGNSILQLINLPPHQRPWANFVTMQILVAAILVILFAILKPRLSVDRPGKLQHTFETIYQFFHDQTEEQIGHHGQRYLSFFGTLFFFILFANLIGIVPGLESPTMSSVSVPAGLAIAVFLYYNLAGIKENGIGKYLAHFAGPMPLLAPLMIPVEVVSHLARPLSLTIRLWANMFAGEQVTLLFLKLTFLLVPAVFMGLHVFVSFLQAYIFMLLSMMYVAGATAHDH
jgi:F-type H+-transporting ATPase subunit a